MTPSEIQEAALGWTIIHAYERGLDDGFFSGNSNNPYPQDDLKAIAYKRGYGQGVWMYCERDAVESARELVT